MSSAGPAPGGDHLQPQVVGDYDAGLLAPGQAATAEAHLRTCLACAGLLEDVVALRRVLAASADPGPMPADVAARIDAALAAARADFAPVAAVGAVTAAARTDGNRPAAAGREHPPGVTPLRRRRPARLLLAAAAAIVVAGLGGLAVPILDAAGGGSGDGSAESAGESAVSAPEAASAPEDAAAAPEAGRGPEPVGRVLATGTDYTQATVGAAARALVRTGTGRAVAGSPAYGGAEAPVEDRAGGGTPLAPPTPAGAEAPAHAEAPVAPATRDAAAEACARRLGADEGRRAVLVDVAAYNGAPAAVVVLQDRASPQALDVFVVEPGCPPGEFLYVERVDR